MVLEEARRQQADLLLIAGDLFHRQPLKRELKEVAAGFAAIPDTEIVLIAGNHDYLHPKSYYRTFAWPDNVHFILNKDLTPVHLERIHTTVWGCSFWDKKMTERCMETSAADGFRVSDPAGTRRR